MAQQESMYIGPHGDPDRYQVWRRIGSGGEGEVWHGTRQLTDGVISVAIKAYHADRLGAGEPIDSLIGRVETQVARLRQLHDPGIAAVHESFVGPPLHRQAMADSDGAATVYLVMKYIDGMALSDWSGDDLTPVGRLGVLNDAAAALDALHRVGQVHGDIKPSNLLVETLDLPDGRSTARAVLVDFGLMRQIVHAPPSAVVGTVGFVAPELHKGGSYSPESDFYAFACVCIWLVCGGPFGQDPAGALRAAGLPNDIAEMLLVGLDPDPNARSSQLTSGVAGWLSRLQSNLSTTIPGMGSTAPMPATHLPTVPVPAADAPPPAVAAATPAGAASNHVPAAHATHGSPVDRSQPQEAAVPNSRERQRRSSMVPWLLFFGALVVIAGLLLIRPWETDGSAGETATDGASEDLSSEEASDSSSSDLGDDALDSTAASDSTTTSTAATTTTTQPTTTQAPTTQPSTTQSSTTVTTTATTAAPIGPEPDRFVPNIVLAGGYHNYFDKWPWEPTTALTLPDFGWGDEDDDYAFWTRRDAATIVEGEPRRSECGNPQNLTLPDIGKDTLENLGSVCMRTRGGGWAWIDFISSDRTSSRPDDWRVEMSVWYWSE